MLGWSWSARSLSSVLLVVVAATLSATGSTHASGNSLAETLAGPQESLARGHSATLLPDGRVIVIGGADRNGLPVEGVSAYVPDGRTFERLGTLLEPRSFALTALLDDGRILVAGGLSLALGREPRVLRSAEIFDPMTATSERVGDMVVERRNATATALTDGRVLIAGGRDPGFVGIRSAEVFDPSTRQFSPVGDLQVVTRNRAVRLPDGSVLVTGTPGGERGFRAERFDPTTNTFAEIAVPEDARATGEDHTATRLADGRVLIVGGQAVIYDSAASTFRAPTAGNAPRNREQEATLLPDGRVLFVAGTGFVAGENADRRYVGDLTVFEPRSGAFITVGSLNIARVLHSVSALRDGAVLVIGGTGESGADETAEIVRLPGSPTGLPATGSGGLAESPDDSSLPWEIGVAGLIAIFLTLAVGVDRRARRHQ